MRFVICDPPGIDAAVPDRRLERWRLPQVEWLWRLDVVVPVEEDRRLAWSVQPFPVHHRVARRLQQERLQSCLTQELDLDRGALQDADVLRADARLGDEPQEAGEVLFSVHLGGLEHLVEL